MRTLFIFLLCACSLFSFSILALAEESGPEQVLSISATVTANRVNVRAGKGLNFEILCQLNKGNGITLIEKNTSWYKMKLPKNASCFVHKGYILNETVQANSLRVRSGAGLNYTVLGMLKKGQKVKALKLEGDWLKIAPPNNCFGWIAKQYVQLPKGISVTELFKENTDKVIADIILEEEVKETVSEAKAKEEEEKIKHVVAKITNDLIAEIKQERIVTEDSSKATEKTDDQEQIQTQKENEVEEETIASKEMKEFGGIIKEVGRIINRPSPYKLVLDDGAVYYLSSEDISLYHYVQRQVSIVGKNEVVKNFPYPVLRVEQIKAAKQ